MQEAMERITASTTMLADEIIRSAANGAEISSAVSKSWNTRLERLRKLSPSNPRLGKRSKPSSSSKRTVREIPGLTGSLSGKPREGSRKDWKSFLHTRSLKVLPTISSRSFKMVTGRESYPRFIRPDLSTGSSLMNWKTSTSMWSRS